MREDSQVSELLCALRRQGVWGSRAAALARDWVEHVREDTAQRVEQGADPSVAQAAAWRALGTPEDLALHAAREFARGSWFGRHPWVAGLVLPILMWVLLTVVLFLGCAWSLGVFTDSHDQALSLVAVGWWPRVFNWLPWLLSLSWFVWMTVRMPGGWRLFWSTTLVLALCSTAFHMTIQPPMQGPGSGQCSLRYSGPGGLLLGVIARMVLGPCVGPWSDVVFGGVAWLQSALLLAAGLVVRFWPGILAQTAERLRAPGKA